MSLISIDLPIGNIGDLTVPTATQQYQLGRIVSFVDTDKTAVKRYKYVKALSAGMTAYQPYVITNTGTAGAEVITIVPSTLTTCGHLIGIPQVAFTASYYGFVLIEGDGSVLMSAETYAVGDKLEVLNTGTTAIVDGTSGSTVTTIGTFAICKEAASTAVARKCILIGSKVAVQAS
jgi:hypothetical protein